jgi:hypothetical protein
LINATNHAQRLSIGPNVAVTIQYARACGVGGWKAKHQHFLRALRRWLGRVIGLAVYWWVVEPSPNGERHIHLAIYIPEDEAGRPQDRIFAKFEKFLRRRVGDDPQALDVQACCDRPYGATGWRNYLLKSSPPAMCKVLAIPHALRVRAAPRIGLLEKRMGMSHALSALDGRAVALGRPGHDVASVTTEQGPRATPLALGQKINQREEA